MVGLIHIIIIIIIFIYIHIFYYINIFFLLGGDDDCVGTSWSVCSGRAGDRSNIRTVCICTTVSSRGYNKGRTFKSLLLASPFLAVLFFS